MHACALKARQSKDGRQQVTSSNSDRRKKINDFNPKMLRYSDLCMENIDNIVHFLFSFLSSFLLTANTFK